MALTSLDTANRRIEATDGQIKFLREWMDAEIERLTAERLVIQAQIDYAYSVKTRIVFGLGPEAIAKAMQAVDRS